MSAMCKIRVVIRDSRELLSLGITHKVIGQVAEMCKSPNNQKGFYIQPKIEQANDDEAVLDKEIFDFTKLKEG